MAEFKVPYLKMRNGRPRWEPGPGLRAAGFRGTDLRDAHGRWLDAATAIARASELNAEVAAWRARGAPRRQPRVPRRSHTCCSAVWDAYTKSPRWTERLAEATRRDYANKASIWLAQMGDIEISELHAGDIYDWWEQLVRERGHAMANGIVAVARLTLSYAVKRRLITVNPAKGIGIDGLAPRCVSWTPEEVLAVVETADGMGVPSVGDAVVLALHTGQRQGDVLGLQMPQVRADGWADFHQSKRGARVSVPFTPQLADRLEAIKRRRYAGQVVAFAERHVVLNETGSPYRSNWFKHRFMAVRQAATVREPSVAGKWFADLRDTAVTRLALAGCTAMQIRAITGHSLETVHQVLKHYLVLDSRMAREAIDRLNDWMTQEGIAL